MEQINNVANSNKALYNNTESERGTNGTIQKFQRLPGQLDTMLQQEEKSQQIKRYAREEYQQWEQSVRPIKEHNLTNEQKKIKDSMKRQYNKDIVFFDSLENGKKRLKIIIWSK